MILKIKKILVLSVSSVLLLSFVPSSVLAVTESDLCKNTLTAREIQNCIKHNKIVTDLQSIVNVLGALAAIVIIGAIIVGGIQYSLAGGSAESVNKAKTRIVNAGIAFVVYLFIFAFMQWIIPGGVFG